MKTLAQALALLVLVALPAGAAAQDTDVNRYTLEGLGGVFVRAEANAACEGAGVTAESVRLQAEGALATSEVDMLTEGEMLRNPALPELRIRIECAASDGVPGAVAYSVAVRVLQSVQMIRDNQITLPEAVTWHASAVGVAPAAGARAGLEEAITAKVGEFAAAYTAVNQQASATPGAR
jgi:hypothetical protein